MRINNRSPKPRKASDVTVFPTTYVQTAVFRVLGLGSTIPEGLRVYGDYSCSPIQRSII